MTDRHCPRCKESRPADAFYLRKGKPGGYCKPCNKKQSAATYRSTDPEKLRRQRREWSASASAEYKARRRAINRQRLAEWRAANPEEAKARAVESARKRRESVAGTLKNRMSAGMSASLNKRHARKKGLKNWEQLAGYTAEQLRAHLESQFVDGMGWENRGKWHIDHKRPLSSFDFNGPDHPEFKKAWAMENLQPMWAKENQSKHAKLNWTPTADKMGITL